MHRLQAAQQRQRKSSVFLLVEKWYTEVSCCQQPGSNWDRCASIPAPVGGWKAQASPLQLKSNLVATHSGKCEHVWSRKPVCYSGPALRRAASAYLPPSWTNWVSSACWKDICHPLGDGKHAFLTESVLKPYLQKVIWPGHPHWGRLHEPKGVWQSREMKAASGFNIRQSKASCFSALEGRLQGENWKEEGTGTVKCRLSSGYVSKYSTTKSGRFSGNTNKKKWS